MEFQRMLEVDMIINNNNDNNYDILILSQIIKNALGASTQHLQYKKNRLLKTVTISFHN